MTGRPERYVIGTSAHEIETESDWELARHHPVVDPPAEPGTEMAVILSFAGAAEYRAVVVRAFDEVDNVSPIGEWVGGYSRGYANTGVLYDVFSGEPVAGAVIRAGEVTTTTGPDGRWSLEEIPYSHSGLTASDEDVFGSVGDYFDYRIPDSNDHNAFFTAYLLADIPIESNHFLDFAHFFMGITDMGGLPYHTYLRHWELPIDLYVRPYERDGLDYKATIEDVAEGLSELFGFTPFNIVEAPVELGVECFFVDGLLKDNYGIREFDDDWYPIWGRIQFRTVYAPGYETAFRRVIAHEFGHVLGMAHSTDSRHLMIGGTSAPQVDTFSPDEIAVIQAIYGIRRGVSDGVFIPD
jgi:hypothetical protein